MYDSGGTKHLRGLWSHLLPLAIGVLAVLVAVAALGFLNDMRPGGPLNPGPVVRVSLIGWTSSGQVLSSGPGARLAPASHTTFTLVLTNAAGGTIEFGSATTNATGFYVVSTDLPAVPSGASENLTVTLSTPSTAYSGPLWINLE